MNLSDLAGLVERADQGKRDIEVKSSGLWVNESGELVADDTTRLRPNDWGWYSVFNKASKGTTKRYMFRHPPEQWIGMVNHNLQHSGDQDWVLRTRGDILLGIVSASHKKFDNREVTGGTVANCQIKGAGRTVLLHR